MKLMSTPPSIAGLPEWVQWLTQDADGTWWGYEVEPLQKHDGWYENEVGRCIRVQSSPPNSDWQNAIYPVKQT
jgi:hypothetical protein